MKRKRILKESLSKVEVAISKALNRAEMLPTEVEELLHLTTHELISEHDLDYLLAEKVRTHVALEHNRLMNQSLYTWDIESRDNEGGFTRTHPIQENKAQSESRMMRQALHEMVQSAQELYEMLSDTDVLPQWSHHKIATARSGLGKVKHYLEHKLDHEES